MSEHWPVSLLRSMCTADARSIVVKGCEEGPESPWLLVRRVLACLAIGDQEAPGLDAAVLSVLHANIQQGLENLALVTGAVGRNAI